MKNNIFIGAFLLGSVLVCSSGQAASITIADNYFGGVSVDGISPSSIPQPDVIGSDDQFNVSSMTVDVTANKQVDIKIYSTFLDNIGIMSEWTNNSQTPQTFSANIQLGDLFISTDSWSPNGTAPYATDVIGGEDWEYALVLNKNDKQTASLFSVIPGHTTAANFLLAPSGFRAGQEVLYDGAGQSVLSDTGSWDIVYGMSGDQDDYLHIMFDSTSINKGLGLDINNFALHWTMTCANDVIEGGSPVPEPATMLLFGTGLIGLAGSALRRKRK